MSTRIGIYNLSVFTTAIWFRTTTTSGVKRIGFGNSRTGSSGNYDGHIYMANSGTLYFGVYPGSVKTINTTSFYNVGNWHQVVASLSAAGMKLYVDGDLVASNASVTTAQNYSGYIGIAYDNVNGGTN